MVQSVSYNLYVTMEEIIYQPRSNFCVLLFHLEVDKSMAIQVTRNGMFMYRGRVGVNIALSPSTIIRDQGSS
jgi:hypothetical protein